MNVRCASQQSTVVRSARATASSSSMDVRRQHRPYPWVVKLSALAGGVPFNLDRRDSGGSFMSYRLSAALLRLVLYLLGLIGGLSFMTVTFA